MKSGKVRPGDEIYGGIVGAIDLIFKALDKAKVSPEIGILSLANALALVCEDIGVPDDLVFDTLKAALADAKGSKGTLQ